MNQEKKSSIMDWAKRHKILTAIIIIFVLGIIGNMMNGDKVPTNNQSEVKISGGEEKKVEEKTVPEPEKPKVWTKVFETSAKSDKQTESFMLEGGQQKIVYNNKGDDWSMCVIYVMPDGKTLEKSGGFPTVTIDGAKQDETMMRKTKGSYYLDIKIANGTCDIEIQELK